MASLANEAYCATSVNMFGSGATVTAGQPDAYVSPEVGRGAVDVFSHVSDVVPPIAFTSAIVRYAEDLVYVESVARIQQIVPLASRPSHPPGRCPPWVTMNFAASAAYVAFGPAPSKQPCGTPLAPA